jgi:hypothetical protein
MLYPAALRAIAGGGWPAAGAAESLINLLPGRAALK